MDSYVPSLVNMPTNETYKKVKAWYNLYVNHKYIPPETVANLNYNKAPIFYRVFVNEVKSIQSQISPSDNTRLYLKLCMTFFNKTRKKFYGRTYSSTPLPLVTQNGPYQLAEPFNVYFYSTIEKGEDNILVVEAQILELNVTTNVLVKDQSLGWSLMDVYNAQSLNLRPATFYSGTPRILVDNDPKTQMPTISTTLSFKVVQLEGFDSIMNLFDEAILCGHDDILPGVVGRALPNPLTDEIWPPKLENTIRVFLEDIVVEVPSSLEGDIIRSAQIYRAAQFNLSPEAEKQLTDVFISERKFIAAYHNSWTAVNSRKFKNFILLHRDQRDKTRNLFVFSGSLDCDGVFVDEFATLILQLEYTITLPKPDGSKTMWNIVVGWKPIIIPSLSANQIKIAETLIKGPGRAPTNQKLYEPTLNSFDLYENRVTIYGRIDLARMNRTPSVTDVGAHDPPYRTSSQPHSQPTKADNEELMRLQTLLSNREKAIEDMKRQYQEEMEAMRSRDHNDYNHQIGDHQNHYKNRMSPEFDEYYQNEASKTRMEVEAIKNMLADMQERERQRKEEEMRRFEADRFDPEKLKTMDYYMSRMSPTKPSADFGETRIMPQSHTREISRADKALLLQSGIKGILDNVADYGATEMNEEKALEIEANDNYKASIFLIQFLAIKASQNAIFRGSVRQLDFGQENFELPSKVYFTYNFFDVPATKTETISLEKPKDIPYDSSSLQYGIPYYLVRDAYLKTGLDNKEPVMRYEIDPSVDRQYNRHIEFAKFLYSKSLTIDIWDAESLMLFGSVKVPLRGLLRQGGQTAAFSKEFDILEPNFMRPKGSLQLSLKNIGKQPLNEIPRPKIVEKSAKTTFADAKKKVKSKHTINLPEEFKAGTLANAFTEQEEMELTPEQRKQERINRYKMATIEKSASAGMTSGDIQKEKIRRELREIDNFREVKKMTTLKAALNQQFKEEKIFNVKPGKVAILPMEVTNFFNHDTAFTINIHDPDLIYLEKPELSVVSVPAEWKYWVEKSQFAVPPEWNMISMENSFLLKANERCQILIKFLTHRDYSIEYQRDYTNGKVNKNDTRRRDYIATRIVNVSVCESSGRVVTGAKLEIVPSFPIIDHIFRFNEQENRNVKLYLPALYHYSLPPVNQPVLVATSPKASVEWLNDKEICLQLKTPPSKSVLKFNLLAYNDIYFAELLGNWIIEIRSYPGVDINVNIGQVTSKTLTLPTEAERTVKCYASHPSMAFFPSPYDKPFKLTPATNNLVTISTRSFSVKNQTILVNCVDVTTKELVYAWLVRLLGTEPQVTKRYELTVRCDVESTQKFLFENRSTNYCIFEFSSSHPDILQPIDKNLPIEGGQKESVRIRIASRDQPGIGEVCLYATDKEERVFECLLFQIKFVN